MSDARAAGDEVLHEQREWFRVTLSSIGDGVITCDTEGGVTFLNPVAQALTGWTHDDALGKPLVEVFAIIHEESREGVENPATRALRDGIIVGLANHTLLVSKDGTERPIEDSAAPIRDARGEVAGAVLVFRDVTERRRHERQVQDALDYADDIIATLREPFLVLDGNLRVVTANRAFYESFHVAPEETQGHMLYDLGNRQWDIPRLRTAITDLLSGHPPIVDYEIDHDFQAIGRKQMLLNAQRIRRPGNHSSLILLAFEDITDSRRAEYEVRISEARYRRLFETARDGILLLDARTGRIFDANPYMTELLGYRHDELLGKELWEIGLFQEKSQNQAAFQELQEKGYVRYDSLPLETDRGVPAEVEFVSNVYQVDSRFVAQCNIRDISERSRLQRRTREQAEALADLHRRKDEFLAMLSHELRSPLAPIGNAVRLLQLQGDENPIQQQARAIIERQVGVLKHLVDDLLEVSRITTGRVQLRQERVALGGIVESAVETARPHITQRQHELTVTVPPQPIWLYADAARLEQVVVNLLTNAAKYTDQAGHIWLSVEQEGDEAVVRVRDTGVGISPELLPRIFDLFTQAERSLARSEGGLGIGLALVQRLVELHRGRVEAHSSLGHGSEFVVRLPVVLSPELPAAASADTAMPAGKRARVLVVDDSVDSAESLAQLLRISGHEVRTVYEGQAALDTALDLRPDVVLLDIGLPGMHGLEVAGRMRLQPGLENVVLVAITGYGQESDRQHSRDAGFDHHLVKPVDHDVLTKLLAEMIVV